jgi:hypothetical protein
VGKTLSRIAGEGSERWARVFGSAPYAASLRSSPPVRERKKAA